MFTYKDMTFCNKKDCAVENCSRKLTDEVKSLAKKYKLPIAYSNDYYEHCDEYKKDNEDYLTEH